MTLLLTILSVLTAWIFLTLLVVALFLILRTLESVRARMEKITTGVRAIERETAPLREQAENVATNLYRLSDLFDDAANNLDHTEESLDPAAAPLIQLSQGGTHA